MDSKKTQSRKKDHVELALKSSSQYSKSAGFDLISLLHNALPELDFEHIDSSCEFLGKKISSPFMVCAMTGGYDDAEKINKGLASACELHKIPFALGSQRAMIENDSLRRTYAVRDVAPSIPLIGNIGAVQLKKYSDGSSSNKFDKIESLVSSIEADALAIHLNPLQEVIQPEGDKDFSGVLAAITKACEQLSVPVIVKETGAGITLGVAERLKAAGVKYIDVSGAGGTSWSKIEYARNGLTPGFEEWGVPTVDCIRQCKGILPLIASGGVRNGLDVAKSITLGADLAGAAYPFLAAFKKGGTNGGTDSVIKEIETWKSQLKVAMFLTGSGNIEGLKGATIIQRDKG